MRINFVFRKICCARLISILGTGLTEFGVGVWVYYETGKVTPMALTMLCALIPNLLVSPISGWVCDKYNRKRIILLADSLAAAMSFLLLASVHFFEFHYGLVCFFVFVSALANTFDTNAYQASITTLVSKEELKTANGLNQVVDSINTIFSPILAGVLYSMIGLEGIILLDLASYLISVMLFLPIKKENFSGAASQEPKQKGILKGFQFLFSQKSLLLLLLYFSLLNFLFNISSALIEPFSLRIGNTIELGIVKACGGIGILCGGLLASFYTWKASPSRLILLGSLWEGIALFLMGATNFLFFLSAGRLMFTVIVPITNTVAGTLWLKKTPQELQGRVYAARAMIAKALIPVSYLFLGPLADVWIPNWLGNRREGFLLGRIFGMEAIEYRSVFLMIALVVLVLTAGVSMSKTFQSIDNET